jgi:hypothetical protein
VNGVEPTGWPLGAMSKREETREEILRRLAAGKGRIVREIGEYRPQVCIVYWKSPDATIELPVHDQREG